jgi:hypothetical protein
MDGNCLALDKKNSLIKPYFVLGLPSGNPEILKFLKIDFGGPWFSLQTSDWFEFWSKVLALVDSFPMVCCMPPESKEFREIPDF